MRNTTETGHTPSDEYKHPNACDYFSHKHSIRNEHAALLDVIAEQYGDDVSVAATGCPSCMTASEPLCAFYVAQSPGPQDEFYLKFDADTDARDDLPDREAFGEAICRLAQEQGVKWSWDGDTANAIHIGESGTYDEEVGV